MKRKSRDLKKVEGLIDAPKRRVERAKVRIEMKKMRKEFRRAKQRLQEVKSGGQLLNELVEELEEQRFRNLFKEEL